MEMPSLSRTRASPKGKSSQFLERRRQYGLKTTFASSNVSQQIQKQDPDLEMNEWGWDEMEASPFKDTTTAIKRPVILPPPTENNHEVEGGNRQDDYSDDEVDNLDWVVLEHPPDTDAKTKLDNTSRLPSSLTCEQRQAHWLLCQE